MDINGHDMRLQKGRVKNIAKDATDSRVSDDAVLRAAFEMEREYERLFSRAKEFANHAGRETIMEKDVMMAKQFYRSEE